MSDMTTVTAAKSDQINADDLIPGPRTVTIRGVAVRPGTEQPVEISLQGTDKFFRPCKTVSRLLVAAWGPDAKLYTGRSLTLYRDPDVTWGGVKIGGIRVSAMSHIDREITVALAENKKARKIHKVKPLVVHEPGATFTIDDARAELAAAETLDGLRKVWSLKAMAPYRAELQGELDKRKAELSDPPANDGTLSSENPTAREGRADEDMGEADWGEGQ